MTIDDKMLYTNSASPQLVFAQMNKNKNVIWPALVEKAWAKIKGSYDSADYGFVVTGLRSLTGAPVVSYPANLITTQTLANNAWQLMKDSETAGYLMGAATAGSGNDQTKNTCGMAMSHAYSIISAFTLTATNSTSYKVLLVRNPWGTTFYNSTFNKNDEIWNQASSIAQVPNGVNPKLDWNNGYFVTPISNFINARCF